MLPIPSKYFWIALLVVSMLPSQSQSTTTTLTVSASLISGSAVDVNGNSSLNIHWGPVWGKTDIHLLDLDPLIVNFAPNSLTLNANANKYFGSGINYGALGDEKWLSWQAAGTLYEDQGSLSTPIFSTIGGVNVTDFFNQLLNGSFAGYNDANTTLTGSYSTTGVGGMATTVANGTYLWSPVTSGTHPLGDGALVQNWPIIQDKVDDFITTDLNYSVWKSFSQNKHGYYLKPIVSGSSLTGFATGSGQTWYVNNSLPTIQSAGNTPLTSLGQISMAGLLYGGNSYAVQDVVLFVDTPEGTFGGTQLTYALNSSDAFFWKGLFYLNGNLSTSGGGSFPSVWMRNPDEYQAAISDDTLTSNTHGRLVPSCYLDGILFITGATSKTGSAAIYGTLCAHGGYGGSGGPDIYYNSRNASPGLEFSDDPLPVAFSVFIAD